MQGFISVTSKIYRQSKQDSKIKEMKMTEIQEQRVQAIEQVKNNAPVNPISERIPKRWYWTSSEMGTTSNPLAERRPYALIFSGDKKAIHDSDSHPHSISFVVQPGYHLWRHAGLRPAHRRKPHLADPLYSIIFFWKNITQKLEKLKFWCIVKA